MGHAQNIEAGFIKQGPELDKAFAALISDLDERGMLDSTLVMMSSNLVVHLKSIKTADEIITHGYLASL